MSKNPPENKIPQVPKKNLITTLTTIVGTETGRFRDSNELTMAVAHLISRNIRVSDTGGEETALTFIADQLAGKDSTKRFLEGMKIGDEGIYSAAGYGYFPHLQKIMGAEERGKYSKRIARIGYETALRATKVQAIQDEILILLKRLKEIIIVIFDIRKKIEQNDLFIRADQVLIH